MKLFRAAVVGAPDGKERRLPQNAGARRERDETLKLETRQNLLTTQGINKANALRIERLRADSAAALARRSSQ